MRLKTRLRLALPLILAGLFFHGSAHAQAATASLKVGCNWFLTFGPGDEVDGNTAYPDTNVYYWLALISEDAPTGSVVHIDGQYDSARYFAFHAYNGQLQEFDSLADYVIKPDPGSSNPYVGPAQIDNRIPSGGSYKARLELDAPVPKVRADNTLYRPAPSAVAGNQKQRTAIVYRTYLKNGTPTVEALPKLTLVSPDGTAVALADTPDTAACDKLKPNYRQTGGNVPGVANLIDPTPPAARPVFKKYAGAALGAASGTVPTSTGTVGYNPENGFLYVKTNANLGDLLLIRGKAPFYAGQAGGPVQAQVRYWSLCQNNFNTQEVIACLADKDAVLDHPGFYTVVMGQGEQPAGATTDAGFNWLPFGAGNNGDPILRYLLQDPGFTQGVNEVDPLTNPSKTMGDYAPLATYCSSDVFAANAASGPEQTFAACAASRTVAGAAGGGTVSAGSGGSNGGGSLDLLMLAMLVSLAGLRRGLRPVR